MPSVVEQESGRIDQRPREVLRGGEAAVGKLALAKACVAPELEQWISAQPQPGIVSLAG